MKCALLTDPIKVQARLVELGTSMENMLEIAHAMAAEMADTSLNDAPGAAALRAYFVGVRRNRDIHCRGNNGWIKDDTDFIASIFNPRRRIRIAISNTDAGTGIPEFSPANRSRKGAATGRIIANNSLQREFDELVAESSNIRPLTESDHVGFVMSYYLCVFCEGTEVRAELSCPIRWDGKFFSDFHERIRIIGRDGDDDGLGRKKSIPPEEFDIPVTRKSA